MSEEREPEIALEARNLLCQRGSGPTRFELKIDSLALHAGKVLVILGPNGAGKSTLLRALAGLERTRSRVPPIVANGAVTLVFQRPAAFSGSVAQNVGAALLGKKITSKERGLRIAAALARFEIESLAQQDARTLSGGEMRRLALARALVLEPRVLLLDEPFDDLDAESQRRLSLDLERAIAETGVAVAMVTHDLRRALLLADSIAVLERGRLVQHGESSKVLMRPNSPEIARTVGMTNLALGVVRRREADLAWVEIEEGLEIPTTAGVSVSERVWVGIRPEHLKIDVGRGDGQSIGKATVYHLANDGVATVVSLRVNDRLFTTHLLSGRGLARRLRAGDPVALAVDPQYVHAVVASEDAIASLASMSTR